MTEPLPTQLARVCDECGVSIRPGDGGVLAFGKRFCSEECADEREAYVMQGAEGYDDDPLDWRD